MFKNIPKYSQVFQYIQEYYKIPKYSKRFRIIPEFFELFQNISKCVQEIGRI